MAAEDYKIAVQYDPTNSNAAFRYGLACFEKQMWDESISYFERVIYNSPETANAYCFRAKALAGKKNYEGALRVTRSIIAFNDRISPLLFKKIPITNLFICFGAIW